MSLVINYKKNLQVTTLLNKLEKLIKMRDIVDSKFIVAHQEEILKTADIIPELVFKYINISKINEYFKYNTKHNKMFSEEFKTIEDWINSEKELDDDFFYSSQYKLNGEYTQDYLRYKLENLELWVECYPQFENMLNRQYFDEYLKNGKVDQSIELNQIEKRFHQVIMKRAGRFIEKYNIKLPSITQDLINDESYNPIEFPIPYGGFYYTLSIENGEYVLNVESWSRVVEGSGEYHEITKDSCELIAEGFI